jgi:TRAP-type C4-dicarboxylate transport system permease small subunit
MRKVINALALILEKMVLILITLVVCIVSVQIIARYILHSPLNWSEELAKLSFVWLIFLGIPLVTQSGLHIQVEYFADKLPGRLKKVNIIVMDVLALLFFVTIFIFGLIFIKSQYGMRSVALNIPMSYFSWAVPVGMLLEIIFTLDKFFRKKNEPTFGEDFIE